MRFSYVYLLGLMFIVTGCTRPPNPPDPSGKVVWVQELIDAHNVFRVSNGVAALTPDSKLQKACEEHALDMAKNGFMSHTGSDGSSPFTRMTRAGYHWRTAGENIAWGQQSVAAVMSAWESDSPHRANLLSGSFQNIGAACVFDAKGQPYWCVDFGAQAQGLDKIDSRVNPETEQSLRRSTSSIRLK